MTMRGSRNFQRRVRERFSSRRHWIALHLWHWLTTPVRWVWSSLSFLGASFVEYVRTRQFRPLFFGLPALIAVSIALYFGAIARITSPFELGERYLLAARSAALSKRWHLAQLLFERSVELGIRDRDCLFDLAQAAEKCGDEGRKRAVLAKLAPDDKPVHARAHLWRAISILDRGSVSNDDARIAEQQLKYVLRLEPNHQMAHAYLGELYFALNLFPSAIEHFRQTARDNTGFRLKLAKSLISIGDQQAAISVAQEVQKVAEEQTHSNPRDIQACLDWAEASTLLEEYEAASRIIRDGLVLHDDPRFREALSMILILWSDSLLQEVPPNPKGAFELLSAGFVNSPNNILLFDRMVALLKFDSEASREAEEFLTQNIVSGVAPGLSHLILGTYYYDADRAVEAGLHLDQAFKLLPNGPIVANNLAWYLIRTPPADPPRALSIIEKVISNYPNDFEYQDTRGHILVKMGRWQEAIGDLENSLSVLGPRKGTHVALSEAYEHLGMLDFSARHRDAAERVSEDKAGP